MNLKYSDAEDYQLLTIGEESTRPITVELRINYKPLTMEVDNGAAIKVQSSSMTLKTYTREEMKVLGKDRSKYGVW